MIQSKENLKEYLQADKIALNRPRKAPKFYDLIWKYEIALRKCEYYQNCKNNIPNILYKIEGGTGNIKSTFLA